MNPIIQPEIPENMDRIGDEEVLVGMPVVAAEKKFDGYIIGLTKTKRQSKTNTTKRLKLATIDSFIATI